MFSSAHAVAALTASPQDPRQAKQARPHCAQISRPRATLLHRLNGQDDYYQGLASIPSMAELNGRRYGAGGMHPAPPAFHWQAGLSGPPITCAVVSTTTRPALTSAARKSRNVLRSLGLIE